MRAVVEVSKLDGSIVGRYRMCTDCDRAHGWRIGKALAQATKRQNPCGTTLLRFADEYEGRIEWPKGAQNVPSVLIDTWTRKCLIRWYRNGNVSIVTAMKIAKHYGYSLDELLGDPEKWQW